MPSRKIQLLFLLGICAVALHLTVKLGVDFYRYLLFNERVQVQILEWEILPLEGRFALKADYRLQNQGKSWRGSSILPPPYYLNELAALDALQKKAKEKSFAWINSKDPNISSLEKDFPINILIRALICYGVLIYFLYLSKRIIRV